MSGAHRHLPEKLVLVFLLAVSLPPVAAVAWMMMDGLLGALTQRRAVVTCAAGATASVGLAIVQEILLPGIVLALVVDLDLDSLLLALAGPTLGFALAASPDYSWWPAYTAAARRRPSGWRSIGATIWRAGSNWQSEPQESYPMPSRISPDDEPPIALAPFNWDQAKRLIENEVRSLMWEW